MKMAAGNVAIVERSAKERVDYLGHRFRSSWWMVNWMLKSVARVAKCQIRHLAEERLAFCGGGMSVGVDN